jgi:hypothetical protein
MVRPNLAVLLAAVLTFATAVACEAQFLSDSKGAVDWARRGAVYERVQGFYVNPGIKKFINSFASYEYPYAPGFVGKSRLEFPIDNWFGGIQFNYASNRLSFNAEIWWCLNEKIALKMQDSDWEDGIFSPDQKTAFSESSNRMPQSYLLDINADWEVSSSAVASLRPVAGVRYQKFHFIAGDGFQWSLPGSSFPTEPLNGDVYDDSFTFLQFYLGAKSGLWLGPLVVTLQADYGWLKADQEDRHLLRGLFRIADNGRGYCWHLAAAVSHPVSNSISLRLEGDFKRLVTTVCPHSWWDTGVPEESWGGAKIWSDQQSLTGYAELRF